MHSPVTADAFFLPASDDEADGQRFCIFHPAAGRTARAAIVHVPPFAEEMNKSRRMAAMQARAFAAAGCAVLQIDLAGCGDSSGDHGDATWAAWVADVVLACRWIQREVPGAPLWLWGLRAGCLLAVEAAARLDRPCHFLFWQPPASGKPLLQQFLRLRMAADLGQAKGATEQLRQQLRRGESVEVAGYGIDPRLAAGLDAARLAAPPRAGRVEWIELSTRDEATLLPASQPVVEQWRGSGWEVRTQVVRGPAFWQTVEIEDAPALVEATFAALDRTDARPVHAEGMAA